MPGTYSPASHCSDPSSNADGNADYSAIIYLLHDMVVSMRGSIYDQHTREQLSGGLSYKHHHTNV
jgi:hypothetical protein